MKNGDRLNDRHPCHLGTADPFHEQPKLVERLLILAEDEPEIPRDGAERVKQAVAPLWQETVRSHSRRQLLRWTTAAAAASVLIALLSVSLLQERQTVVASLDAVGGIVSIESSDGTARQATTDLIGAEILSGTWLTTDRRSRAAVTLASGQSVRLDIGSRIRLDSAQRLTLVEGGVYVDSGFEAKRGTIEIDTPLGVARDIGTQFELRVVDGSLRILVREGRVALLRADGELEIAEGTSMLVGSKGEVGTSPIDPWATEWDWVQVVTPTLSIEGKRLMVLLDWVSRETGRWISFSDAQTEALASTTVLHGTIDGLTPARALQVVLPGCGMKVQEINGAYAISSAVPAAVSP